jgi:CheY-like chemotaxis protein
MLDNAVQAAQRGATLTRRLLAFARRQELNREFVDLAELVRGMTDLLERTLGSQVEVQTIFPLRPLTVFSDPNQLELAILNLVVNARDAMPNGGTIIIKATERFVQPNQLGDRAAGRYICLSIADEGEGMDRETLRRATEPIFTTKGVGKGTGLGLPMAHGVAEQSDGRLTIESTKGVGTTVSLWLPYAEVEKPRPLPAELVKPSAQSRSQPLKILTVDDDSLVLENTALMLEDLGHMVMGANSGSEALKILAAGHGIQLVLTDQNMPGMTGTQLAQQIGKQWPDIHVVLATGYAELPPGEGTSLRKLAKPYTQADLSAVIADVAFKGGSPAEAGKKS